jgi:hypothetical protein
MDMVIILFFPFQDMFSDQVELRSTSPSSGTSTSPVLSPSPSGSQPLYQQISVVQTKFLIGLMKNYVSGENDELLQNMSELQSSIQQGKGKKKNLWMEIGGKRQTNLGSYWTGRKRPENGEITLWQQYFVQLLWCFIWIIS